MRQKKYTLKLSVLVSVVFLMVFSWGFLQSKVYALVTAPDIQSEAALVLDAETGEILFEKNGHKQYFIASTTKVMTAILAYEHLDMDAMITVGENPPFALGSSMGFKEGEEIMVKDLLYALMLHSANDAAEILAEAVAGSTEAFAELMTEKARSLGAVDTVFYNPSGLNDDKNLELNNITTAKDLSIISKEFAEYDELVELSQKLSHMLPLTNLVTDINRWATNKNKMVDPYSSFYYEPTEFGKTGWTPLAGFSWTASAMQDGRRIIVSLLKSPNQEVYFQETKALMEWAFEETAVVPFYSQGQMLKNIVMENGEVVPLFARNDFYYVSSPTENPKPFLEIGDIEIERTYAPGETVHTAKVLLNDEVIGSVDLVCENTIEFIREEKEKESNANGEAQKQSGFLTSTLGKTFGVITLSLLLLVVVLFGFMVILGRARRTRRHRKMSSQRMAYLKELEKNRRS